MNKRFWIRYIIQTFLALILVSLGFWMLIPKIGWSGCWAIYFIAWGMVLSFKQVR